MTTRPMRADAHRNRERLLEIAVRAFSRKGADVPLEAIAKQAGVGIGTLYRHFPTRDALVEAAYRNELARLCDSAQALLARSAPDAALRRWMSRFLDYVAIKQGMADALAVVIASGGNPYLESRARLTDAITALVEAGIAAGTLRDDVAPTDILVGLTGISRTPAEADQKNRLLDLLMDALRKGTGSARPRR